MKCPSAKQNNVILCYFIFSFVDLHMMFHCSIGFFIASLFFHQNKYAPQGPIISLLKHNLLSFLRQEGYFVSLILSFLNQTEFCIVFQTEWYYIPLFLEFLEQKENFTRLLVDRQANIVSLYIFSVSQCKQYTTPGDRGIRMSKLNVYFHFLNCKCSQYIPQSIYLSSQQPLMIYKFDNEESVYHITTS